MVLPFLTVLFYSYQLFEGVLQMKKLILLMALLGMALPALADVLKVPETYPTIQAAIDASISGDVVLVSPGTYVENIKFPPHPIAVIAAYGPGCTIIDGGQPADPDNGSVVRFTDGQQSDSVLKGFTLRNGTGTLVQGYPSAYIGGGGIVCYKASPTIHGCRIENNTAREGGGLILS